MKTISNWSDLEPFGIVALTGGACRLACRILCDLTQRGKRTLERCLSVEIRSASWNSGSKDDPHVASIMLTREMLVPLAVFALLDSGCGEVWSNDHAAFGFEAGDTQEKVERLKEVYELGRSFAYHGPHKDRNQHQMSGRVR